MGFDFLSRYGGRRLRQNVEQPPREDASSIQDNKDDKKVELDLERSPEEWDAIPVTAESLRESSIPQRFVDGCHYGKTVACLKDSFGHPIPVRLGEIGGVCMRIQERALRREFAHVERIVCMIVDPFPWHEIEDFALSLEKIGLRLLRALPPEIDKVRQLTYDFASMEQQAYVQSQVEMRVLEELALAQDLETLTLVDGPLGRITHPQAVGTIKQPRKTYVHSRGSQLIYSLNPGERTPAFRLASQSTPVISWYLKIDGEHGSLPNWGVIRVEISSALFERNGNSTEYIDRLSHALLHLRCRQSSYARAPVSMQPIVRAEESLKSLLTSPATLAQQFYRKTGL